MNTLLCADNPDSLAWCEAVRSEWPADSPPPLWWNGSEATAAAVLEKWHAHAVRTGHRPRLFGATSRAHSSAALVRLMADPLGPQVWVAQDYWGDVVGPQADFLDPGPASRVTYLVRDTLAESLTASHLTTPTQIEVVGAARLAPLEQLNVATERARLRQGWPNHTHAVLWLGQAPPIQAAYLRVVHQVAQAVAATPNTVLLDRHHIRQTPSQTKEEGALWQALRVDRLDASEGPLWPWLAAADLVLTCFSNGGVEAVHLNRVAPMACNRSLFVLTDPELRAYHALHSGLDDHPLVTQGLALQVSDADALPDAVATALNRDQLQDFWRGPLRALVPGQVAATKIAHLLSAPAARALF